MLVILFLFEQNFNCQKKVNDFLVALLGQNVYL